MTIDWFTIVAEIINFLLLVYLLRRFLYPVIIRAMDQREKLITSRLDAAEAKLQEATKEEASYLKQKQDLAASAETLTAKAREDAEKVRQKLSDEARADVDADKARWREAVKNQQEEFLKRLRVRAAEQVVAMVRRTLQDLADAPLEERIVAKFLQRLEKSGKSETAALKKSLAKGKTPVVVASAFGLSDDAREQIRDALKAQLGKEVNAEFTTSSDLIGGIELRVGELRISWTLQSYLDDLEQEVSKAVEGAEDAGKAPEK